MRDKEIFHAHTLFVLASDISFLTFLYSLVFLSFLLLILNNQIIFKREGNGAREKKEARESFVKRKIRGRVASLKLRIKIETGRKQSSPFQ